MKNHFFGAISLALALTAMSCEPAHAQEAPTSCQSVAEFTDKAKAGNPGITFEQIGDIQGESLPGLLALVNSTPPKSDVDADQIVIFRALAPSGKEFPEWALALFKDGCEVGAFRMPSNLIRGFLGNA
jgi:hypothetical protein